MKFKDGFILGMAFYLGYNIMEGIDNALSKRGVYRKILRKIRKVEYKKPKESKVIIGFKG